MWPRISESGFSQPPSGSASEGLAVVEAERTQHPLGVEELQVAGVPVLVLAEGAVEEAPPCLQRERGGAARGAVGGVAAGLGRLASAEHRRGAGGREDRVAGEGLSGQQRTGADAECGKHPPPADALREPLRSCRFRWLPRFRGLASSAGSGHSSGSGASAGSPGPVVTWRAPGPSGAPETAGTTRRRHPAGRGGGGGVGLVAPGSGDWGSPGASSSSGAPRFSGAPRSPRVPGNPDLLGSPGVPGFPGSSGFPGFGGSRPLAGRAQNKILYWATCPCNRPQLGLGSTPRGGNSYRLLTQGIPGEPPRAAPS